MSKEILIIKPFLNQLEKLYKNVNNSNILLIYEGEITHQIILGFNLLVEKKLEASGEKNSVHKKVFNALVELLQNIYNHGDYNYNGTNFKAGKGALALWHDLKHYHIVSCNIIKNQNIENLEILINKTNTLEGEELREFYKEILANGRLSKKGVQV
ncbi:MAG: SiaB family protein kinase [Bacteroidota bacterium]